MSAGSKIGMVMWLAALAVGCGKVQGNAGVDAGAGADAGQDAGPPIDDPTPITVTVLHGSGDGTPDTTAKVVFQDPQGNVVADVTVDAQGKAQSPLPHGGSVTAVTTQVDTTTQTTATVTTITEVVPGDALLFGLAASPSIATGGQTSMTATFPSAGGTKPYTFFTPCGTARTGTSPVTLSFRDSCHGTTFDLLGTTLVDTTPVYVKLPGVTYKAGDAFSIPNAFVAMPLFSVNAKNVPVEVDSLSATRSSLAGDLSVSSLNVVYAGDPPAGAASVSIPYPEGYGTRSEVEVIMGRADAAAAQHVEVHTAGLGASVEVDVGKQPLAWISNFAQTANGATWTQVAAGDGSGAALLSWTGQWSTGGKTVTVTRNLAQPASKATVGMTLPPLPTAYAAVDPEQQSVAVAPQAATLYLGNYDTLNGYTGIRLMPETLLTTSIGNMGAFLGKPYQRRIVSATTIH